MSIDDLRGNIDADHPTLALGRGPPVAQSSSSTVWTTGTFVPLAI